ncbi:GATOR complex protein WDR59 [Nematolebias whitei]|uniref:GATOR complex protein WDR59 n=1 Tax=Nematolebias whitei TaxID=451745 RepID=UPI00189882C5|nr:GATOR complex protein WDR59 [Nematolebias whitei]
MAARWSSENVVVEFRDAQATAMSVDCLGSHAVLSCRHFLYMVNLEAPSEAPRKIGHHSKWDLGSVQWNPHRSESHVFAASVNQRVDLYWWREGCGEAHASLQGHTRVISDLDWSWFDPELLVTSSVDTYIYIWDTRDTRKPTVALSAVAGASQVKWNKKNRHLLASSHDGDIRVWDKRKPSTAVEYVAAHLSKIHGLDWHPDNEFIFATSSQDNSVKFWDYRQPRKYLNILSCQVPVWKARYTPFSNGLVTVMVPQLRRENSLLLWSTLDFNSPVHAFVGHDDVVLEFQWRPQKEGSKDFQLVTWSRDQTLRIWRVDPQLQKLCVSDMVEDLMEGMSLTMESEKSLSSQEPEGQQSTVPTSDSMQGKTEIMKSRRFKTKREGVDYGNRPIKLAGKVIIQEISCLLPVHKTLGESYILDMNDIQDTCQKNAAAALAVGRRDVAKVWALAAAATSHDLSPDPDPDAETPWARHPFGRHLLETLLDHYSQMSDVQTLAMLCSVFRAQAPPPDCYALYGHHSSRLPPHCRYPSYTSSSITSGSCSSTSDSTSTWTTVKDSEHAIPWGEPSPDDYRYGNQGYTDPRERERELHDMNKRLLDPANTLQFDDFKKCYGEILYRWDLRDKRADVLKFTSSPPEPHKGIEFGVYCCHCRSQARGTQCAVCKRLTFQCAVCHVAVRGSSNFCLSCGHGGHTNHMMDWFRRQDECPAGCGCQCLLQSTF